MSLNDVSLKNKIKNKTETKMLYKTRSPLQYSHKIQNFSRLFHIHFKVNAIFLYNNNMILDRVNRQIINSKID